MQTFWQIAQRDVPPLLPQHTATLPGGLPARFAATGLHAYHLVTRQQSQVSGHMRQTCGLTGGEASSACSAHPADQQAYACLCDSLSSRKSCCATSQSIRRVSAAALMRYAALDGCPMHMQTAQRSMTHRSSQALHGSASAA